MGSSNASLSVSGRSISHVRNAVGSGLFFWGGGGGGGGGGLSLRVFSTALVSRYVGVNTPPVTCPAIQRVCKPFCCNRPLNTDQDGRAKDHA